MKNFSKRFIWLVLSFFLLTFTATAQVPDEIISSIQEGNDEVLASYFNQNIELVIQTNDDVFSKSQAQQIVSAFFKANKPKQFAILHQGGKDGARYVIGNLVTSTGTFRVYFLIRSKDNQSFIHQLKIEKQG